MKKQSLGLLLSTGPENPNLDAVVGLSEAALHSGKDVYLYLIDEGVLAVEDPRFEPLRQAGLKLFACAYGAQQHGVPRKDERATYCGLVVLSNIISSCDRFVALNWVLVVDAPTPSVLVIIQADPFKSARAVEALRIALGLGSHNEGKDLQIILSGRAPHLLADDSSEVVDSEILEKHLPVFVEWGTTFLTTPTAETPHRWLPDCKVTAATAAEIVGVVRSAKKILVFWQILLSPMTLHLLKHPVNPLAIEVLRSTQTESPTVVLLSPTGDIPQLPGVTLYHVSESDRMENGHGITYSRLVEMIFAAEKVVAW